MKKVCEMEWRQRDFADEADDQGLEATSGLHCVVHEKFESHLHLEQV
jgi:hypothetical protein